MPIGRPTEVRLKAEGVEELFRRMRDSFPAHDSTLFSMVGRASILEFWREV